MRAEIDVKKYLQKVKNKKGIVVFKVPFGATEMKWELLSGETMPIAWITWKVKDKKI